METFAFNVLEAAEAESVESMTVGAIAAGAYAVPRSTRDIDLPVSVKIPGNVAALVRRLSCFVHFDPQVTFDNLTSVRRHVGTSLTCPPFKVELFETFDDPFVISEFARRCRIFVPILQRETWLTSSSKSSAGAAPKTSTTPSHLHEALTAIQPLD